MSRRNRTRRPAQLNKAVSIRPAATFTVEQVQALANSGLVGPSIPRTESLPRDPRWATVPFAPGTPLFPQAINIPQQGQRQAEPRQWEYPVSWNLPGFSDRLIPWAILRSAADIPVFRQCIETRKAEAVTQPWDIRVSQNAIRRAQQADPSANINDVKKALQAKVDPHIGRLIDFWSEPDRWNGRDFTAWATMALEEIMVLDALPIYPRRTKGGDLYGFEVLDGTTIKPLLDDFGRRPLPPNPAYQQILYGFPRGEYVSDVDLDPEVMGQQPDPGAYAADQLVYHVTHTRTFTPYGHSAVERALQDGDLWMRRHGWLKAEYTDGVMPSGWLEAGEGQAEWTPNQLEVYEKAFNDYYAGATASRQRYRILPWGMKPSQAPDLGERYKPDYDLFLLKLVVRHFDTNIQELGFNEARGLGSAGHAQAQERVQDRTATQPTLDRLGKLCTRLQQRFLDAPVELEFVFPGDEDEDAAKEDEMWSSRIATGRATRNEDRDRQGMPRFEFPEADMPAVETGTGLLYIEGSSAAVAPGQVFSGGQPPGLGLPGEPPPGPGEGGPGGAPSGGSSGAPGPVPPKPPTPGGPPAPAGGESSPGGLTKADLDWLDGQLALTRPGATGLEAAQAALSTASPELVKTELGAYRKWSRNLRTGRVRGTTFTFLHAQPRDLLAAGIDPTTAPVQYLAKADQSTDPTTPAPPNRQWPGWQLDLAAAAAGGAALLAAIEGSHLAALVTGALVARGGAEAGTTTDPAEATHLLDELHVRDRLAQAITPVIHNIQTGGYLIGSASAANLVHGEPMPQWQPGDWSAASRLLTQAEGGTGPGLRAMLAQADIRIKSIADTQVEALARILADGLTNMQTPAQIAQSIQTLGVTRDRADMIAHTELSRASGQAALDRYQEMAVPATEWITAPDERVCPKCAKNRDHGPVPLGEAYPSGDLFPPGHPRCRCVPAPVLLDMAKADAIAAGGGTFDEAQHPRSEGGKFGDKGGSDLPAGGPPTPPPVTVADIHNASQQSATNTQAPQKLTAGALAKQNMARQMQLRNELLQRRLTAAQARQAAATLRQAQAQAAAQAKKAAAAGKKSAKASAKQGHAAALSAASAQAQQILAHLDQLAAGKTEHELAEALGGQYPDLTRAQVAELIKAWDPVLHPRDPLTGRFVSVGVRRPAFKPGTRKRWGRSKQEIKAWEWAHRHGEQTRFVDAGRAGARGVGHAGVNVAAPQKKPVDPDAFRAVGQRNVQENMLVGRNHAELEALAGNLGMAPHLLPKDLHGAKQAIIQHELDRRAVKADQRAAEMARQEEQRLVDQERQAEERAVHNVLLVPRHNFLDVANGNRPMMANALKGLRKDEIVQLAKERGHQIDGVRAKRDDLVVQFMGEEARKRAFADAVGSGMGREQANSFAEEQARNVMAAHRQHLAMENDIKVQRRERRKAREQEMAAADAARRERMRAREAARQDFNANPPSAPGHPAVQHDMHLASGDAGDLIRQGQAKIADHLASGEAKRSAPDVQGAIGETAVVTHKDGAKTVHKYMSDGWYDGTSQADSEELGAHLALHLGLKAPVIRRDPNEKRAVDMEFLDGYTAASTRFLSNDTEERIRKSPAGRRMALLDAMIGNTDRHSGNWMVKEGQLDPDNPDIAAIDHGFSFPISDRRFKGHDPTHDRHALEQGMQRGIFSPNLYAHGKIVDNNYTAEEIDNARTALERMKPEFDRLHRMSWYNLAQARLAHVAKHSMLPSAKEAGRLINA